MPPSPEPNAEGPVCCSRCGGMFAGAKAPQPIPAKGRGKTGTKLPVVFHSQKLPENW